VNKTPDGYRLHYGMELGFLATNNIAEYESIVTRLTMALQLKIPSIEILATLS